MRQYDIEDARLRALFRVTRGTDPDELRAQTGASYRDAWRVAAMRQVGCGAVVDRWLRRVLTWRQAWRLVTDHPSDPEAQLRELAKRSRRGITLQARKRLVESSITDAEIATNQTK